MRNTEPTPQLAPERYAPATALCEWKVRERVRDVRITPRWLGDGDRERLTPEPADHAVTGGAY